MTTFKLKAKEFKKMLDPVDRKSGKEKFVCYLQANKIPQGLSEWMRTNPRDQKMTTSVARSIGESLRNNQNFHELNRGIVMSVESVEYDNKEEIVTLELENPDIHGNIDGGHTLRAIFDAQETGDLFDDRYVFAELFTGINSPVELAAARNTSVQVDLKSIEELKHSFSVIKEVVQNLDFHNRIAYKMNEHLTEDGVVPIDVREIITILNMFNQKIYPIKSKNGTANDAQPIQSYTGKEVSLKKFLNLGETVREKEILNMQPIVSDIFRLWELIECEFALKAAQAKKKYGSKKYSKYDDKNIVGLSLFGRKELQYLVPKGILYPVVGAFRALVVVDPGTGMYNWKVNPFNTWNELGPKLTSIVLEEKEDNPEYLGKSGNLWSNLYKEVLIYSFNFGGMN